MKKNPIIYFVLFFILNFGALAIGGSFTGEGVSSDWNYNLLKAPWTPPGWVFGAAWTTIMICFSFYMATLYYRANNKSTVVLLFSIQWILNVAWNPVFFYFQAVAIGLITISFLTLLIGYFLFKFRNTMSVASWLIVPYFIWLLIATSLNAYIVLYN